jgi:hypothetical protein
VLSKCTIALPSPTAHTSSGAAPQALAKERIV